MYRKLTTLALGLALAMAFSLPVMAASPVNVNKADAATIAKSLDGIGMAKARAIVAYRKAHGPFKSAADLGKVKGIGNKTLTQNKAYIRFSGHPAQSKAKHNSKH